MTRIVGIAVTRAGGIAATNPGFELGEEVGGLVTALEIERIGELILGTPAAGLDGTPRESIDSTGVGGEGVQAVRAEGLYHDILGIGLLDRRGTIIRLEDVTPVVV